MSVGSEQVPPRTLAEVVRARMGEFTASERRVARAFVAGYPRAGLETVAQLAARAGVSGPTVVRFVSRLGFGGYPAFQEALRAEVQERLTSALNQYEARPPVQVQPDQLLRYALGVLSQNLETSLAGVPAEEFWHVVDMLADRRLRIISTGGRFSQILAFYLNAHLNMMRPGCQYVAAAPTPRVDQLIDVGRRTVVVCFDYRRYQNSTIQFAQRAHSRGARVILFTDPWLSPIADVASHVLTCTITAPSPFDSLVPALGLVEAIIAGLALKVGESARIRMEELEQLRVGTTWDETGLAARDGGGEERGEG